MEKVALTEQEKKLMKQVQLRSHLVFQSFTMVQMQANGFTMTLEPALEQIYADDPEGKKEAYARAQEFFNTHAVPFSFIAGLTWAMEKKHKEDGSVDGATIENIKSALMGPTAGMFDSLFFNCLRVIAAGIGIGLCSQGSFLGTIIFILIYGVPQSIVKFLFVKWGYVYGTSLIENVFNSGVMNSFTKAASILGMIMIGAMTAGLVNVPLTLTINIGETSVVLADIFNSIFPGLLGVLLLFWYVRLIRKGVRPTRLVLLTLAIGILGALIGIF
jgi:PTS system mannose-specific IID component